jgi:uncharacterized protein YbjT (DUF2867 family)
LDGCHRASDVEVVAGARSQDKAAHLEVRVVHMDFDKEETLEPALQGVERVLMMTGYTVDMFRQCDQVANVPAAAGMRDTADARTECSGDSTLRRRGAYTRTATDLSVA